MMFPNTLSVSGPFVNVFLRSVCLDVYYMFNWIIWYFRVLFLGFYVEEFGTLPDVGLVKKCSSYVGCSFVFLTLSFALWKVSISGDPTIYLLLSVLEILVFYSGICLLFQSIQV